MDISAVETYIFDKLRQNLSPTLFYHGINHTIDVVNAAQSIATNEGINDEILLKLIKTAALFHDLGFICSYRGHEHESCRIAQLILPQFGYTPEQIDIIIGMIMATKIPQSPKTILEKILADADLDYLGREDYEPTSELLFQELKQREMLRSKEEWVKMQVDFLEKHQYWTKSSNELRNSTKYARLKSLKSLLNKKGDS
ncbi:metal-dependent phosphohydrolase HD sub domain-containing protein [Emticicia oligotrophica DSM 17448]|uniref:Metal-dependent phosphohydrolase HD sub domain-containing protein n=1 Tax=Emticicia oligotrophica (strain DSM 17448 / CIP 109782 / MTCC 6937 / GPTSA100-15) TaxID=929562 RepID=A0ABM5N6P4_EMTOG|nr:HD domain-containing protein [Emticicia oligotrophica]AFK05132.1 metal-dependent phosphohydrolase HD sub domain-containing protein [Emticicia oligotrophica DSM 17448]